MYCIYKVTNLINNKVYIGKTNNLERRKREHEIKENNSLIDRAIKKYGEENFVWEILEFVEKSQSNEREKYWIDKYNSYFRDENSNGYNMTRGGDGGSAWNLQQVHIYDIKGNYLRTFETISQAKKFYNTNTNIKNKSLLKGKYITIISKDKPKKQIEPYKRKSKSKPILQLDENKNIINRYNSISEAGLKGYNRTGIIGCLKKYYKKSSGYYWCYENEYDDFSITKEETEIKAYKNDRIVKLSLKKEVLDYYLNCSEAARKNNIKSNKAIHKALKSKTHFSNNYLWIKESDLINMLIPR